MKAYPYLNILSDGSDNWQYQFGTHADPSIASSTDTQCFSFDDEQPLQEWLSGVKQAVTVIIPGEKVVTRQVPYSEKEKRHFATMLPYEIEDSVVGDVDELHFSIGPKKDGMATIAYLERRWFDMLWQWLDSHHVNVQRCVTDFQLLPVQSTSGEQDKGEMNNKHMSCLVIGPRVQVHNHSGLGFSSSRELFPHLLRALIDKPTTQNSDSVDTDSKTNSENSNDSEPVSLTISLYSPLSDVNSDQGVPQNDVQNGEQENTSTLLNIINTIAPDSHVECINQAPELSLQPTPLQINFCCGDYKSSASSESLRKEFTPLIALGLVATLFFFAVNIFDGYLLQKTNQQLKQKIEQSFRQVVPQGVMNDPIRQLTRQLGAGADNNASGLSQTTYLLSKVAPLIQQAKIELSAIYYSHKDQSMRLNIQADSFQEVETLRTNINQQGLKAELLSSNAVDDKFQARLRVQVLEGEE